METNFDRFNSYLLTTEIFSLVFTCRFIRRKYMPKLKIFFELADGFGSQLRWHKFLKRTFSNFFSRILYTDIIEDWTLYFLFQKFFNYVRNEFFYHLNLPSILFHFLTCKRSCDINSNKCMRCSRVFLPEESLWNPYLNFFEDVEISKDNCSFFQRTMLAEFDVFKSKAHDYFKRYSPLNYDRNSHCMFYKEVYYCDELFSIFCSHLIRIFLNTFVLISQRFSLSATLQKEFFREVIGEAIHFFTNFIHQFNIEYFYEFFDKFKDVSNSYCYSVTKKKKFGPYIHSAFDVSISIIRF